MVALNMIRKSQRLIELKFVEREIEARSQFQQRMQLEEQLTEFSEKTVIDDREFLERLYYAGFRAETVNSLQLYPIVMAAWASGTVTDEERLFAEHSICSLDLFDDPAAVRQFRHWLKYKPEESLWCLWQDYMQVLQSRNSEDSYLIPYGKEVYQAAERVALASGGCLGFGKICPAERKVLERIQGVFHSNV